MPSKKELINQNAIILAGGPESGEFEEAGTCQEKMSYDDLGVLNELLIDLEARTQEPVVIERSSTPPPEVLEILAGIDQEICEVEGEVESVSQTVGLELRGCDKVLAIETAKTVFIKKLERLKKWREAIRKWLGLDED